MTPTDELLAEYQKLQLNKKKVEGKKCFLTCKIEKGKIVVDKSGDPDELKDTESRHKAFVAALCESGEPRYGMVDLEGKVFFVSWISDNAKIKLKMKYASVREPFKGQLTGLSYDIPATEAGDLDMAEFTKQIKAV